MIRQLPLGLQLPRDISFGSFVTGRNREVVEAMRGLAAGGPEQFIYLWGCSGSGKTHLLQAACKQAQQGGSTVSFIPLDQIHAVAPAIMEDLERTELVCIDDIQAIAGQQAWEAALFRLFNRLREQGHKLAVAADNPAGALKVRLPDLKSRLGWGPNYHLLGLDDDERLLLLMQAARGRGLELSAKTARYLLHRCPRDIHFLERLIDHLDRYSLATQRRLTIPLVREALREFGAH